MPLLNFCDARALSDMKLSLNFFNDAAGLILLARVRRPRFSFAKDIAIFRASRDSGMASPSDSHIISAASISRWVAQSGLNAELSE